MKINMIGTGAINVKERSSCILIDDKILIDCGNGTIKTLLEKNIDISKIKVLLITHLHGDHIFDIPFLIGQRSFSHPASEFRIIGPPKTEQTISNLFSIAFPENSNWNILKEKAKIKFIEFYELTNKEILKDYCVNSYPVIHGKCKYAYGYTIKHNNKTIGISGDSTYCKSIDKLVNNSNISVLDMTFIDRNDEHMGINDIKMLIQKYNKPIISTHMTNKARDYAIKENISNLIIPNDGEIIEI